jgi:flagellin
LGISEKFKADIRSTRQALRNTQDAISLTQVAEGGLNEVSAILIRMRELSIQAATDTNGQNERGYINLEVQALKSEIDRIAAATRFNGTDLLTGEGPNLEFQVGIGSSPERDRVTYNVASLNSTTTALGIEEITTLTKEDAQANLDKLDRAIGVTSGNRAAMGALQNRLQSTSNNLLIQDENYSAANSRIRDADFAMETAELTKRNILTQTSVATLAQANNSGMVALKLV